jgi:hypothetical protein
MMFRSISNPLLTHWAKNGAGLPQNLQSLLPLLLRLLAESLAAQLGSHMHLDGNLAVGVQRMNV